MTQSIPIKWSREKQICVRIQIRQAGRGIKALVHCNECVGTNPRLIPEIKILCCILLILPWLASCSSPSLVLGTVGPGPFAPPASTIGMGDLQVYSKPEEYYEDEMSYFPHSDYQLYAADGRHLRRVWNHNTHEDETPAVVSLPPGRYVVKAWAEFYGSVNVPVVIKPNELTKVVLQPGWNPVAKADHAQLVQTPNGYFVGYQDEQGGANP
jgi:hypothetical protein